jgi:hypothetical protein
MMLFLATLLVIVAAMALMAVGVMLRGRPLPGSCGRGDCECRGRE